MNDDDGFANCLSTSCESGNAWRHAWTMPLPAEVKSGTLEQRPEFRREMVIVDGQVLTPAKVDIAWSGYPFGTPSITPTGRPYARERAALIEE